MSNRIAAIFAAAAILAPVSAFAGEITLASTVDRPLVAIAATRADAAATQSPGTVGAMHYATAGLPVSFNAADLQTGRATAATVRWLAAPERAGS